MTFSLTLFGPRHHYWDEFKQKRSYRPSGRVWFNKPDKDSTGAVGFCVPGLHIAFNWGREKRKKT